MWRIYYSDHVVEGETREEWLAAPDDGVQVVVIMEPYPDGRRPWTGVEDRQLFTGEDEFSIYGWPAKRGLLIETERYFAIWERACGDP